MKEYTYRDMSSSGAMYQNDARTSATAHQAHKIPLRRPLDRVSRYIPGTTRTASSEAALVPPHMRKANPESKAMRAGGKPRLAPRIRGSRIHGMSSMGCSSAELYDSRVNTRGARA